MHMLDFKISVHHLLSFTQEIRNTFALLILGSLETNNKLIKDGNTTEIGQQTIQLPHWPILRTECPGSHRQRNPDSV